LAATLTQRELIQRFDGLALVGFLALLPAEDGGTVARPLGQRLGEHSGGELRVLAQVPADVERIEALLGCPEVIADDCHRITDLEDLDESRHGSRARVVD
jgi:hypothetical protein